MDFIGGQETTKTLPVSFANQYTRLVATAQNNASVVISVQGYCNRNVVALIGSSTGSANWIAMGL